MQIDIPVTIHFDCNGRNANGRQTSRTFTLRFDTVDTSKPAQIARSYPPAENSAWTIDHAGILFGLFNHDTDRIIAARALAKPSDYAPATNDNSSLDDVDCAVAAVAAEIMA